MVESRRTGESRGRSEPRSKGDAPSESEARTLQTGIVGAGIVSQNNHLPAIDRNPRTELAAVCDVDAEQAREAAAEYGTRAYDDLDAMLANEDLQWAHVATPVDTHLDIARRTVEAGIPTTVQKPAVRDLDELDELLAAADEADVPVSVVHNWLFYPIVREVRERLKAGEIGEIRAVETTFTGEGRPDETYRGDWVFELPGGDLEEGLAHPLYLTLALGGYPSGEDAIDAQTRTLREYDRDVAYDGATVEYVSSSGALCSVTMLSEGARESAVRVHGSEGSLHLDIPSMTVEVHDDEDGPYHFFEERMRRNGRLTREALAGTARNLVRKGRDEYEERFDAHREDSVDGHYYLFDRAAAALQDGEQPPVSLEHSRWTLTLLESVRDAS